MPRPEHLPEPGQERGATSRRPTRSRWLALLALLLAGQAAAELAPVVEARTAGGWWRPLALAGPAYPRGQSGQACVHLAFRIDDDGRVRGMAVLKRWSSRAGAGEGKDAQRIHAAFAQAAAAAALQWRFTPAGRGGRPIVTALNLAFDDRGKQHGDAIRAHCAVGDLVAAIGDAQALAAARGSLVLSEMDREGVSNPMMIDRDRHGWGVIQAGDAP